MAPGGHEAVEPQEQYDPDFDLSKLEKGFVDLVELVRTDGEYKTPANLRKELKSRYDEVIEKILALLLMLSINLMLNTDQIKDLKTFWFLF